MREAIFFNSHFILTSSRGMMWQMTMESPMPVYFDHNATTATDPRVVEAMLPFFTRPQNASSLHAYGRMAKEALEAARDEMAARLGVQSSQVYFTSGGSESNNLALKGIALRSQPGDIIQSAIEHECVREAINALSRGAFTQSILPVDANGVIALSALPALLSSCTRLVSVMLANNETGAIQPTKAVRECLPSNVYLHVDAVQAFGKLPFTFESTGAHTLSISSHKIFGPAGVGALIVAPGVDIAPLIDGGGQERGLRSGTENIAGIVGFAKATTLAFESFAANQAKCVLLQNILETGLASIPNVQILSQAVPRLPNTTLIAVPHIDGETLALWLNDAGFCVSSGSACSSGKTRSSHVVEAMLPQHASHTVRISLSHHNTELEVKNFIETLTQLLNKVNRSWW